MTLLCDLQYFSCIIYYKSLNEYSNIVFDTYETYSRASFGNRTYIAGSNGVIGLSIPLLNGRNQKGLMKDIKISEKDPWQSRHWKSIESAYNRSPWFEFYKESLSKLYRTSFAYLRDWNMACHQWILVQLNLEVNSSFWDSKLNLVVDTQYIDRRGLINPRNYASFRDISYAQVFQDRLGFLPNLSILDLLFCEGKGAFGKLIQ